MSSSSIKIPLIASLLIFASCAIILTVYRRCHAYIQRIFETPSAVFDVKSKRKYSYIENQSMCKYNSKVRNYRNNPNTFFYIFEKILTATQRRDIISIVAELVLLILSSGYVTRINIGFHIEY